MAKLFAPLRIRGVEIKNRVWVSPMCQYTSVEGMPSTWHLVHYGSRAIGGAGLVMAEATAVSAEGRISASDTGIWSSEHVAAWAPITRFIREHGSVPAIQLAHAGRKASCAPPWEGGMEVPLGQGGWQTLAPSAIPFYDGGRLPRAASIPELEALKQQFVDAALRSVAAGFEVVELHFAHGYFGHEMLSPLSNTRTDEFGGSQMNRMRWPLAVASAVRAAVPSDMPLFVRISATDWAPEGVAAWDVEQSVEFVAQLRALGVDLVDVSSGGNLANAKMTLGPGYQVPFASAIRRGNPGMLVSTVGLITEAHQAEKILEAEEADVVMLARELLRDPYWPLHAAGELGVEVPWPAQYLRAKPSPKH